MITPVISLKIARKILGSHSNHQTDEQVAKLVEDVDLLARLALRAAKEELAKRI